MDVPRRTPRRILHRLRTDPLALFAELKRTQGDVAVTRLGRNRFVLVSHPEDIKNVLVTDAASYERQVLAYKGWRAVPPPTPRRGWFQASSDPEVHLRVRRATELLRRNGPNALPAEEPPPGWRRFLEQYRSYMQIILLGAAVVSLTIREWNTALLLVSTFLVPSS